MNDRLPNPYCPICGEATAKGIPIANGVGPADMPLATKFLHMLPSSHLFYDSANLHDILYHIGRTEEDRKNADNKFLEHMLVTVRTKCSGYKRPWFTLAAYRNYYSVRWLGGRFFSWDGCNGG